MFIQHLCISRIYLPGYYRSPIYFSNNKIIPELKFEKLFVNKQGRRRTTKSFVSLGCSLLQYSSFPVLLVLSKIIINILSLYHPDDIECLLVAIKSDLQ